jgi:broad specificity phosphatase PhoE
MPGVKGYLAFQGFNVYNVGHASIERGIFVGRGIMTTTIYLVRHGQTRSNVTGYYMGWSEEDLDEVGYDQARKLASRLACLPIASIYTSPLKRAYTTASLIAGPHGLQVKPLDDLIEVKLGDWQGLHESEIERRWPELWRQSQIDPSGLAFPNGESFMQVAERATRAFEAVVAANKDKRTVMVTHDIVVRILAAYVLGVTYSIYRRIKVNNASLSVVWVTDSSRRLVTLNDTAHYGG